MSLVSRIESRNNIVLDFNNYNLHQGCVGTGNVGLVKFALNKGQPVNSILYGLQALHLAALSGNLQIVKMLVEAGADVNAPRLSRRVNNSKELLLGSSSGVTGWTPLHFAASKSHTQIVEFLLARGSNPTLVDKLGERAEEIAQKKGYHHIEKLLQSFSNGVKPIQKESKHSIHPQKSFDNLALKLSRRSSTSSAMSKGFRSRSSSLTSSDLSYNSLQSPEVEDEPSEDQFISLRRNSSSKSSTRPSTAPSTKTSFTFERSPSLSSSSPSKRASIEYYRPRKSSLLNPNLTPLTPSSPSTSNPVAGVAGVERSPSIVFDEDSEEELGFTSPDLSLNRLRRSSSMTSEEEFKEFGTKEVELEPTEEETIKSKRPTSTHSTASTHSSSFASESYLVPPPPLLLSRAPLSPLYELPHFTFPPTPLTPPPLPAKMTTEAASLLVKQKELELLNYDLSKSSLTLKGRSVTGGRSSSKGSNLLKEQLAQYGKSLEMEKKLRLEEKEGIRFDVIKSSGPVEDLGIEVELELGGVRNPSNGNGGSTVKNWSLAPAPSPLLASLPSSLATPSTHLQQPSRKSSTAQSNFHFESIPPTVDASAKTRWKGKAVPNLPFGGLGEEEKEREGSKMKGLKRFFGKKV